MPAKVDKLIREVMQNLRRDMPDADEKTLKASAIKILKSQGTLQQKGKHLVLD